MDRCSTDRAGANKAGDHTYCLKSVELTILFILNSYQLFNNEAIIISKVR
jgi:hypothetical protein